MSVAQLRLVAALAIVALWEALSFSGLFFRDVIPSLEKIVFAFVRLPAEAAFWTNFATTLEELAAALLIGGALGLAAGCLLGSNDFLARAYERWLDYLGPTPKIILFPIIILVCGVGLGSKVAMGAVSCFFPMAITAAAGVRGVDRALVRVGRSFQASPAQMLRKIYLPAMTPALINGARLGFGVAAVGVLLAETKLSKAGLGFLVMDAYSRFDMPRMYALLAIAVILAAGVNGLAGRLASRHSSTQRK